MKLTLTHHVLALLHHIQMSMEQDLLALETLKYLRHHMNQNNQIGPSLFFCVNGKLLFHYTNLEHSEKYGDFYNYPYSHFQIWMKYYEEKYKVDFDFYPRGRVVYRITDDTYLIYFDPCMEKYINKVVSK